MKEVHNFIKNRNILHLEGFSCDKKVLSVVSIKWFPLYKLISSFYHRIRLCSGEVGPKFEQSITDSSITRSVSFHEGNVPALKQQEYLVEMS